MKTLRIVFAFVFTALFALPVFAADMPELSLSVVMPSTLTVGQDAVVTIEVKDADGKLAKPKNIAVSFVPQQNVFDDVINDCGGADADSCSTNNRGVLGVYESVFNFKASPVVMKILADGATKEVQLVEGTQGKAVVVASPDTSATPADEEASADAMADTDLSKAAIDNPVAKVSAGAAKVQVGPFPSVWFILLPLAAMLAVVTRFVMKTTK